VIKLKGLDKQYSILKTEIDSALQSIIDKQNFILGEEVGVLEKALADYVRVKYCDTCANGTDAIILALMACGITKGDAIFVPDFTFIAPASCAVLVGATPIFIDVEIDTFNISPDSLEEAIIEVIARKELRPKAIITVNLFGLPANYPIITQIAKKYGLLIIEDGAQGFGGKIGTQRACSFGDISTTSFFPVKPLGCYGDGGALFMNDERNHESVISLRAQGRSQDDKYENIICGFNSRLDTIQAAILMPKFQALVNFEFERINIIAHRYTEALCNYVSVPFISDSFVSAWAQYSIIVSDNITRSRLVEYLKNNDIETAIYYPRPLHEQKAFTHFNILTDCKNSKYLSQRILSIPIHPYMTDEEVENVCAKIISFFMCEYSK
jgi:dTDP-4-amino-4,6-dideoxygalactose transaminase